MKPIAQSMGTGQLLFRVRGSRFRDWSLGPIMFRVWALGLGFEGFAFRIWDLGFGFAVWDLGCLV